MQNRTKMWLSAATLLCLTPVMTRADHKMIQGRTGLPLVRDGKGNVWMERGNVNLNVSGNTVTITQDYRLHYPGPPLETGPEKLTIAVREDFFRSTDNDAPKVTTGEAKGFTAFSVTMDGRKITTRTEPWKLVDKEDTATRWRVWDATFQPGQKRTMRIVSKAPLGEFVNKKYVEFRTKDIADWRGAPALLEIRFTAPGQIESQLSGLEPKPTNINSRAIRWVYREARPRRDIYAQLPASYARTSRR